MKLRWKQGSNKLEIDSRTIPASCLIRNELNGLRKKDEPVKSIPSGALYYPRIFPLGIWTVGKPEAREQLDRWPFFIPTDAWQYVEEWEGDLNGHYLKNTGRVVKDMEYGLHHSKYRTTLGCIRIGTDQDVFDLVDAINEAHSRGDKVTLKVYK